MMEARDEILKSLGEGAQRDSTAPRPPVPDLPEKSMGKIELIERFTTNIGLLSQYVGAFNDPGSLLKKMNELFEQEGVRRVMVSEDDVMASVGIRSWAAGNGVSAVTPGEFGDRRSYTDAVFTSVDAGITGIDYAIAETGTLIIVHRRGHPRLVSHAPLRHFAIVPVDRILPVHENLVERLYDGGRRPNHVTWISAPSQTSDIQATMFLGMHGPQKLFVFLLDRIH